MALTGLQRYDEMQRRPFGTNTALSSGSLYGAPSAAQTDANQFRRQGQAYGQALRALNRSARRGDARAALKAIEVRDQANASGFSPGGITNREQENSRILGMVNTQSQRNNDAAFANDQRRSDLLGQPQAGGDAPRAGNGTPLQAGGVRAGYGTPLNPARRAAAQSGNASASSPIDTRPIASVPGLGAVAGAFDTARANTEPQSSSILARDNDLTRKRNAVSALRERFAFDENQKKVMEDRTSREGPAPRSVANSTNQGPDFSVAAPEGGFQRIGEQAPSEVPLVERAKALSDINRIVQDNKPKDSFDSLTQAPSSPAPVTDMAEANQKAALQFGKQPYTSGRLEDKTEAARKASDEYDRTVAERQFGSGEFQPPALTPGAEKLLPELEKDFRAAQRKAVFSGTGSEKAPSKQRSGILRRLRDSPAARFIAS